MEVKVLLIFNYIVVIVVKVIMKDCLLKIGILYKSYYDILKVVLWNYVFI